MRGRALHWHRCSGTIIRFGFAEFSGGARAVAYRLPDARDCGRARPRAPPQTVEPVARAISGARFEVLQTGHYAAQTPELLARAINEFLDASGA